MSNNTSLSNNSTVSLPFRIPHHIRFSVFLSFDVCSLICTLFVLRHLLFDRTLRRSLHNHIIIILLVLGLFYELTNISFHLRNAHYDVPWSAPASFYLFWVFLDYSLYSMQISLFAWASFERHILIFHDQWMATRKKRLLLHYLPPVAIIIYDLIYYCMVYFVTPCDYSFDYYLNGGLYIPCAFDRTFLSIWDLIVHQAIPTFGIMIMCFALLIRVIRQKTRMQQSVNWRKHRKMTVQLLSISVIYVVFNTPWVLIVLAYQCGLLFDRVIYALIYAKFLLYNIFFFFPFVSCLSLPKLKLKLKEIMFCHRQQHQIHPSTNTRNHTHHHLANVF